MKVFLKRQPLLFWMAKNNASQNEFAKHIGSSSAYISQIFNGSRNPSPKMRENIMRKTGLKWEKLFSFSQELKGRGEK